MAGVPARPERVVLSRDFSEFLVELSIALHKYAMYPGEHPSLGPAAERVTRRAELLLEDRATIAFGVARHQLIIEGVATDPHQPVLRRLAEALHRHHLGAVSIARGVTVGEMCAALRVLSDEVDGDSSSLKRRPPEWPHLRLHQLTFDRLQLIADPDPTSSAAGVRGEAACHAAQLWVGLASAALATEDGEYVEAAAAEPAVVARAIDEHREVAAYDQVIVGYLMQIADELKGEAGVETAILRRRTARLISALRPETLRRLVEMGGDAAQRQTFVLNATSGMAVDSVIELLKAAADASGQVISHGLVRMLSKLAAHAEYGQEHVRSMADGELREQVHRLMSGWSLADPNPDAYGRVLQHLATNGPSAAARSERPPVDEQAEALRIVQMSLEVGSSGPLVERAIDRAIHDGNIRAVRQLLSALPADSGGAAESLRNKLRDPRTIELLVAQKRLDPETLDYLLPWLSIEGYTVLLDALVTSDNRTMRRRLLDRLAHTDLEVAPLIISRLDDERWYVQRNMLLLLGRLRRIPASFSPAPWTQHTDARVRYQAIHLQLSVREEREWGLHTALEDADLRIVRLGLLALQQECPRSLVPLVAHIALDPDMSEELRVRAVRVLGCCRERFALEALLRIVDGGRTVLGRPRLAPRTPVVVAAVQMLAQAWPTNSSVASMLSVAVGSPDPEVREAARATPA